MAGKPMTFKRLLALLAVLAVAALARQYLAPEAQNQAGPTDGGEQVARAAAARQSGVMVTAQGLVARTLADDKEGSRHQRFLLELPLGLTVLVAHNIDLAPRVPLENGDEVAVRGQYEWNEKGGVIHWTHADPSGRHEGGWIGHQGRKYQ